MGFNDGGGDSSNLEGIKDNLESIGYKLDKLDRLYQIGNTYYDNSDLVNELSDIDGRLVVINENLEDLVTVLKEIKDKMP